MPPRPSSRSITHIPSLAPIMVHMPHPPYPQHISRRPRFLYTDRMEPSSPPPGPPKTALVLIAHGSRNAEANADLEYLAEEMRRRGPYPVVEASYLELAEPTPEEGGTRCVEEGAGRVILLPYFLSAGVHVERDLAEVKRKLAD